MFSAETPSEMFYKRCIKPVNHYGVRVYDTSLITRKIKKVYVARIFWPENCLKVKMVLEEKKGFFWGTG